MDSLQDLSKKVRIVSNEEGVRLSSKWKFPFVVFVHDNIPKDGTEDEVAERGLVDFFEPDEVGKKRVRRDFPMNSNQAFSKNGAAQRRGMEELLAESRLGSVVLLHFIEFGTEAHRLFTSVVPDGRDVVPRMHVFPPAQRELVRAVLYGSALTPQGIHETLRVALQMPPPMTLLPIMTDILKEAAEFRPNAGTPSHPLQQPQLQPQPHRPTPQPTEKRRNPAPSPTGLHFVAIVGLEKKEVVVTSPGMTLRTVWQKVQKQVEREAAAARAEGVPSRGVQFELHVESPPHAASLRKAPSAEIASRINIHELPHNTSIRVVWCDASGGMESAGQSKTSSASETAPMAKPRASEPQPEPAPPAEAPLHREKAEVTAITVRCSLPDGRTHAVDGLPPSTATLAADLRAAVADVLGHNRFVFARPYPPHQFTPAEESAALAALGIRTSSALRVVTASGPSAPSAAEGIDHADPSAGIRGIVSSILTRLRRGSGEAPSATPETQPQQQPQASGSNTGGGRFRTMAEMRAKEEEEERRAALEEQSRDDGKGNHYYGGSSTEFIARKGSDEKKDEGHGKGGEGGNAGDLAKKNS